MGVKVISGCIDSKVGHYQIRPQMYCKFISWILSSLIIEYLLYTEICTELGILEE